MTNLLKISAVLSILLNQCVSFETVSLDDPVQKTEEMAPKSALETNAGDLFKNANWEAYGGASIGEDGGQLEITPGSGRERSGAVRTIEGLDFRGDIAVKVSARADGAGEPKLRVKFYDAAGRTNNSRTLTEPIHIGQDFQNYYYKLDGSFYQVFPESAEVKASDIVKMELEVSGGGKVIVRDIDVILSAGVVAKKKAIAVGTDGGQLEIINPSAWTADGGLELSGTESSELVIKANAVGPKYEALTADIPAWSLATKSKVKVSASWDGEKAPYLRLDLIDNNGLVTNKQPIYVKMDDNKKGQYQDLIFDFDGRFLQSYPNQTEVDPARITKVVMYVNAGHYPFTGNVSIRSIEAVK